MHLGTHCINSFVSMYSIFIRCRNVMRTTVTPFSFSTIFFRGGGARYCHMYEQGLKVQAVAYMYMKMYRCNVNS